LVLVHALCEPSSLYLLIACIKQRFDYLFRTPLVLFNTLEFAWPAFVVERQMTSSGTAVRVPAFCNM
jgi:hypothetical protein